MSGCPGSRSMIFSGNDGSAETAGRIRSELRQWPIQLHLVSPQGASFHGADVLLAADCVPFAMGNFHGDFLKGKALAIACPKLDGEQEIYLEKIRALFEDAKINTLTVVIMQVPCCRGLISLTTQALNASSRKVSVKCVIVSLQGEPLSEEWINA